MRTSLSLVPKVLVVVLTATLLTSLTVTRFAVAQEPAETESTGVKIGNIVREAVTTALPVIGPIMDAIWPNRKKAKEVDKNTEVVPAAELEAKLKAQKIEMQKQLVAYQTAVQAKFTELGSISREIDVLLDFLEPALVAQRKVIPIEKTVTDQPDPSEKQWEDLARDWSRADESIQQLGAIPQERLQVLSSQYLRDRLGQLRNLHRDLADTIGDALKRKDRAVLLNQLSRLNERLNGINAAAGYLMDDLGEGFAAAAEFARGEAALAPESLEQRAAFAELLDQAVAE